MGRPRKFTPQVEAEIARRRAAGETTTSIAAALGTSTQNIDNSLRRTASGDLPGHDEFEAKQADALAKIDTDLAKEDLRPVERAVLTKAMNDTIKAIRQHRLHSGPAQDDPDALDAVADQVIARLERLNARSPQPPPASLEVVEPSEDIETGS